jgi:hypothetical protein
MSERKVNILLLTRASRREKTQASSSRPEPIQRLRSPKVDGSSMGGRFAGATRPQTRSAEAATRMARAKRQRSNGYEVAVFEV